MESKREKVEALLVTVLPMLLELCDELQGSVERRNVEALRHMFAAHVLGGLAAKSGPPDSGLQTHGSVRARLSEEAVAMADSMLAQLGLGVPGPMMGWPSRYEGVVADSAALAMDRSGREDEPVASIQALGPPVEGTRVWLFVRDKTAQKHSPEDAGAEQATVAVPCDAVGVVAPTSSLARKLLETDDEPVASREASHRIYGQDQRVWFFRRGY